MILNCQTHRCQNEKKVIPFFFQKSKKKKKNEEDKTERERGQRGEKKEARSVIQISGFRTIRFGKCLLKLWPLVSEEEEEEEKRLHPMCANPQEETTTREKRLVLVNHHGYIHDEEKEWRKVLRPVRWTPGRSRVYISAQAFRLSLLHTCKLDGKKKSKIEWKKYIYVCEGI